MHEEGNVENTADTPGTRRHADDTLVAEYEVETRHRRVKTLDGIELDTLRMGKEPDKAVIICHGYAGNKNAVNLVALAEDMSRFYTVYTFDFRGHGLSGGKSTFYFMEVLDILAVVALARGDGNRRIGVMGFSMGGMAALRYAGIFGGLDSVIAVGVAGDIRKSYKPWALFLRFLLGSATGRALAKAIYDVKVDKAWKKAAPPSAVVGRIYPQPMTIIQGKDDRIFPLREARSLYRRARGNARFKSFDDFGHAEEGYDRELFAYLKSVLEDDFTAAADEERR